jgi:DNA-binding LacI/PurR family transcriptional regulator
VTTIYSIAERCGVSPSTVSRAFSRPELVRAEVREHILATAHELDYRPNRNARGLAKGLTGALGLVVPDITNPFFPPLVRAIENLAWHRGQSVLLVDTAEDVDREQQAVARLQGQVDGVVFASPRATSNVLRDALAGLPGVIVNRASRLLPHVMVDDAPAVETAVTRLAALGHRRLAYVGGPADSWMNSRRLTLLKTSCAEHRIELIALGNHPATSQGGRASVPALLDSGATVAVAFDDVMASGVLAELSKRGVAVPGNISVLGCDDVVLSAMLSPALSSLASSPAKIAAASLAILLDDTATSPAKKASIPSHFIERASTDSAPRRP